MPLSKCIEYADCFDLLVDHLIVLEDLRGQHFGLYAQRAGGVRSQNDGQPLWLDLIDSLSGFNEYFADLTCPISGIVHANLHICFFPMQIVSLTNLNQYAVGVVSL